jgi:hypothetical protein
MLAIWGFIVAAAALAAAIVVPIVLYIRENGADIKVTSRFDETGFVEVVIAKTGRGVAHIDSIELMAAGANTMLPLVGRSKIGAGPIDFDGGIATKRAYFTRPGGATDQDAIEVRVEFKGESFRVNSVWTLDTIFPLAGTEMVDLRAPGESKADTAKKEVPAGAVEAEPPLAQPNTQAPETPRMQRNDDKDRDIKS